MKKSIVATVLVSTALVVSVFVSSCAAPAGQPTAITPTTPASERRPASIVAPATQDERLEGMQQATGMLINQYLMNADVAPDSLYDLAQSLETARRQLLALDGQREAIQTLIGYKVASGEPVQDAEYEFARSIEQSRQEILRSVGLKD